MTNGVLTSKSFIETQRRLSARRKAAVLATPPEVLAKIRSGGAVGFKPAFGATPSFRAEIDTAARQAEAQRVREVSFFKSQVSTIENKRGSLESQQASIEAEGKKIEALRVNIERRQASLVQRGTPATNRLISEYNSKATALNKKSEAFGKRVDAYNVTVSQSNIRAVELNVQPAATPFVKEFVAPGDVAPGLAPFGLETRQARAAILRQKAELKAFRERPPPTPFALEPIEDFPLFVKERVADIKAAGRELFETAATFKQQPELSEAARKAGEKAIMEGDFGKAFGIVTGETAGGTFKEIEKRGKVGLLGLEIGTGAAGLGFVALGEPVIGALPEKEVKFDVPFIGERKLTKGGFRASLGLAGELAFIDAAFRLPAAAKGTKAVVTGGVVPKALRLDQPLIDVFGKTFAKDLPTEQIFTKGKFLITEVGEETQVAFLGNLEKKFLGKGLKVKFARQLGFEEPARPIIGFFDEKLGKKFVGDLAEPFALETKQIVKEVSKKQIPPFLLETGQAGIKGQDDFLKLVSTRKITGIKTLDPRFGKFEAPLIVEKGKTVFRTPTAALGLPPEQAAKIQPFLLRQPITGKAFVAFEDDLAKGATSEFFQIGVAKPTRIRAGLVEQLDLEKFLAKGVRETKKEFSERIGSDIFGFTTTGKETKLFKGEVFGDIKGILEPEPGIKAKAVGKLFGEFKLQDDVSKFVIKPASVEFISFEKGVEAIGKTIKATGKKTITPFSKSFAKEQATIQKGFLNFLRTQEKAAGGLVSTFAQAPKAVKARPVSLASILIPGSAQALALGLPVRPRGEAAEGLEFLTTGFKAGQIPGFEKQKPIQGLGQGLDQLQKLTFGRKLKPVSIRKQKQELETRLKQEFVLRLKPVSAVIPTQKFITSELIAQRQKPILAQRVTPIQKISLMQRLRTVTSPILAQRLAVVQTQPPPTIKPLKGFRPFGIIPLLEIGKPRKSKITVKRAAFEVLVKRQGKLRKASKKPLRKNTALALGAFLVDNSASRTFRIKETIGKPTGPTRARPNLMKFRKPIFGGKVQRKSPLWIEETKHALDSKGEFEQVTKLGLEALRRGFFKKKTKRKRRKR